VSEDPLAQERIVTPPDEVQIGTRQLRVWVNQADRNEGLVHLLGRLRSKRPQFSIGKNRWKPRGSLKVRDAGID
jgi:hypothetical protein